MLIDEDDKDGIEYARTEAWLSSTTESLVEVNLTPEVSLNSVIGLSNPKSMKLLVLIGEPRAVIMIDHGATHNFIFLATVKE